MKLLQSIESRVLLITLILICIAWLLSPQSGREKELQKHIEKEAVLKSQLDSLEAQNKVLREQDKKQAQELDRTIKRAEDVERRASAVKIIYREARYETDAKPDSANMAKELTAARELIDVQEVHINELLAYQTQSENLLRLRLEEIRNQDKQLQAWQERFDNAIAQKDEELKAEKKKGRGKFLKGVGLGGVIVAVIVLL